MGLQGMACAPTPIDVNDLKGGRSGNTLNMPDSLRSGMLRDQCV